MHFSKPSVRLSLLIVVAQLLLFAVVNPVVYADTEVSWILSSDTTWTKEASPYSLTGNLLVDNGVTLTIEAGVTVYLNEYSILVNGTVRAHGTETDKITFQGSKIEFTEYSNNWNEQTGSGSIIEHAIFDSTRLESRSTSLKITECSLSEITIGGSSIFTYNTFNEEITGSSTVISPVISHNTILNGTNLTVSGSAVISNNIVSGQRQFLIQEGSATVTGNTFSGLAEVISSGTVRNNTCLQGLSVDGSSICSNNTISGTLYASGTATVTQNLALGGVRIGSGDHVTVSDNIIYGGIRVTPGTYQVSTTIIDNTITNGDIGILILPTSYIFLYASSRTDAHISGNTISNFSTAGIEIGGVGASPAGGPHLYNDVTIEENTIIDTNYGIKSSGKGTVKNNIIAFNEVGVSCGSDIPVEGNLIMNNNRGITGAGEVRHNTIVNNGVGIYGAPTSIVGNNIYNNTEYNLRFDVSFVGNATENWWGTADSEEIAQTIYDYYDDFYLGIVNFTPFLTQPNPQAPPTQTIEIPEFSSWIILPMALTATLLVITYRQKLNGVNSRNSATSNKKSRIATFSRSRRLFFPLRNSK